MTTVQTALGYPATQVSPTFSSADVCRQTGVTYRMLDSWVRRGYLKPDRAFWGSGYDRAWPQEELDRARMMARLVSLGVSTQQAAQIARDPAKALIWFTEVAAAVRPR